jgi:hypothetical protein
MLMRGDLQKIFDQINPVFEGVDKRLKKVEEVLAALQEAPKEPKKPVGRPKKQESENKVA